MICTILGSGSALPIPREDRCKQCRSKDRRDKRWPSALLIDRHFLIDAPVEIVKLLQSVKVNPSKINHVVVSHHHRDASGGLKFLKQAKPLVPSGYRVRSYKVPHGKGTSKAFLINDKLLYCTDYSEIKPLLPGLRKAKVAILDGSGWQRTFPSHQPINKVIPLLKPFKNLKTIYFSHNGHSHIPHHKLKQMVRELGDQRFMIAYHGLAIKV